MEAVLTLENLGTLAGIVALIEIVMQLYVKPALRGSEKKSWYGLALNVIAFVVGPIEPATNRGRPGVEHSSAACLANRAAS